MVNIPGGRTLCAVAVAVTRTRMTTAAAAAAAACVHRPVDAKRVRGVVVSGGALLLRANELLVHARVVLCAEGGRRGLRRGVEEWGEERAIGLGGHAVAAAPAAVLLHRGEVVPARGRWGEGEVGGFIV
jgi:hypothetical protein